MAFPPRQARHPGRHHRRVESTAADFLLEITGQGWLGSDDEARHDLCSHGDVRLEIGGQVIAPGDGEREYTISTSALALLRSLEAGHSPERPVADRLVLHCGMLLMTSCPIGIDWSVSHVGGRVRLHDVVRYDTTDERQAARFPGLSVELESGEYRGKVAAFAEQAKQLFIGADKALEDDFDRELYEQFWREFDARLSRALR
jgi:hypothetical protein